MPHVYAFTGHRPQRLGGHSFDTDDALRRLARWFLTHWRPEEIVSGMALGWDMAVAEVGIEMGVPVTAAVPFDGQEMKWPNSARIRYRHVLSQCAKVVVVCDPGYAGWKMLKRDQWMVNNSTHLVGLWDGSADSGTGRTMAYAAHAGRLSWNLWPQWITGQF